MIRVNKNLSAANWIMLDGCASGWICSTFSKKIIHVTHIIKLNELKKFNYKNIYIDMPVTLPKNIQEYPRQSDKKAKKILGKFHSSIFYAPPHSWLTQKFQDINTICENNIKPKLSKQSFNLFKKIKETSQFNNEKPNILYEIHPETLVHGFVKENKLSKKTQNGIHQRLEILKQHYNCDISIEQILQTQHSLKSIFSFSKIQLDDIIDSIFSTCLIHYHKLCKITKKNDTMKKDDIYKRFSIFK